MRPEPPHAQHVAYRQAGSGAGHSRRVVYIVRAGDTLWRIANLFQVKVAQILTWNAISLHTPILAGQKLHDPRRLRRWVRAAP